MTIPTNSGDKVTILVAEDDEINFMFFEELFLNTKYQLIRAKDGKEAVDIFQNKPDIQLVLMDIKMPVMNGYEAFKEIKKINPDIPIIAQTAYGLSNDEKKIRKVGFSGYVAKPIDREVLFSLIAETLSIRN